MDMKLRNELTRKEADLEDVKAMESGTSELQQRPLIRPRLFE
jgi:hypothetical protein